MAIIMEAFSIREYASKMRNVDVVKSWPFSETSEENVKAILPPITVKKFRWWLDEVEKISINNCIENIERNSIQKQGDEEESDHDSESLASIRRKRLQKMKSKAPKKRSIVELFAVAPEVERVSSDEEDPDEGPIDESGFGKLKSLGTKKLGMSCKSTKQKIQKKVMGMNMINHSSNQKIIKKKRRINTMKEKIRKFKMAPSLNSIVNPDGFDSISIHSKKTKVKSSSTDAKSKARRTSKKRKQDFHGRGMLKRLINKTHISDNNVCLDKIQNLNKKYALSVKAADDGDSAIQKTVSIQEMEETEEEEDEETFKWRGNQPPFENQLRVQYHVNDVPNFLMQHRSSSSNLFNRSVPPSDQRSWHNDNLQRFVEHDRRNQLDKTSLLHPSEDLGARVASARSMDHFKESYPSTFNGRPQFPSKTFREDYNELSLQRPWFPPLSPKEELMKTIRCVSDQRSIMQIYGERSVSDNLFGLPLNSQGELIRLSSIENGGMYQLGAAIDPSFPMKKPCFGARQDDQYMNYRTSEIIQHSCSSMQLTPSTMRLMGQEFRIDGSGFPRPENREFYKEQYVDTATYGSFIKSPFLPETVKFPLFDDQMMGYRSPSLVPAIVYHDTFKNTSRNWLQPENREMSIRSGKLPLELPFSYSEFRENNQPPKRFEAREKGSVMGYNQAFGVSDSVHLPWTAPSMAYQTTESSKLFPHYSSQNTFPASSTIHHLPTLQQDSVLLKPYGEKMKYQIQYNSRIGSGMINNGNQTKKRMASALNQYHTEPNKMPRCGSQEDSRSTSPPVENWDGLGSDSVSGKYKPYGEKMFTRGKDSSYKAHHGAVKLTAGAKHVLKPCQRKESAFSTTPFVANQPGGGGALACEKSSEIMKP